MNLINPEEMQEALMAGDMTGEEALASVATFLAGIDTIEMTSEEKQILEDNLMDLL